MSDKAAGMSPPAQELFAERPRAQWKGKNGGAIKAETAMMRQAKEDRLTLKRRLKATIEHRKEQDKTRKASFQNPVKSMTAICKEARRVRYDEKWGNKIGRGKVIASSKVDPKESKVILVVKNDHIGKSKHTKELLYSLGLRRHWSAVFLENTPENWTICLKLRRHAFYGCPTKELLDKLIHNKARLWNTVDAATIDIKTAIGAHQKYVDFNELTTEIKDNRMLEDKLGYLGILCVEDLVAELYEDCSANITKHLAPMQLEPLKRDESETINPTVHDFMKKEKFVDVVKSII